MTANRHHPILSGFQELILDSVNCEFCFSLCVRELAAVAHRIRQMKIALANSFVKAFEAGNDTGDGLADARVVSNQIVPIHGCPTPERGLRYSCNNSRLAAQVLGCRRSDAFRAIYDAHTIFDGDKLRSIGLPIDL
jgi:hypothetical protein